jgi:hypothetical protein
MIACGAPLVSVTLIRLTFIGNDMNTIFALIILTANGPMEAHQFTSMVECTKVQATLKSESFCAERKPVDINSSMDMMFNVMKNMKTRMEQL